MKVIWDNPFMSWLILTVLTYSGVFWAWYAGLFVLLYQSDFTRIAISLFVMFIALNISLGFKAFKLQHFIHGPTEPSLAQTVDFYDGFDLWYYVISIFPYIGFMGTVIGLANLMQTSTGGLAVTDEAIRALMQHVGTNSGAALYPTLVGGLGMLLLKTHVKSLTHSFMRHRYATDF